MMQCCEALSAAATSRRALLLGGASFAAWAYLPRFARAADGRDPRLIVVILRGALDGLATVAPVGDPDYASLHGSIALTRDGPHAAVMLDSFFAAHPSRKILASPAIIQIAPGRNSLEKLIGDEEATS